MIPLSLVASGWFSDESSIVLGRIVFTGVVFLPTLALHFAIEFLGPFRIRTAKRDLSIAYFFTFVFLYLVWTSNNFISGIYVYSWGHAPKGGYLHMIHSIFVLMTALYSVFLLRLGMSKIKVTEGKTSKYYETKYVFLAFLFVTCASCDLLQNWGYSYFPLGCIYVTLFALMITYGIFRHRLMGITFVVKKSLLYSALLSVITCIYFSLVYVIAYFVGGFANARSVPTTIGILAIIIVLFRPLERKINSLADHFFHKQSRELVEAENTLLKQEVQKQNRLQAVATLAAGMAHEIKNPLTAIKTFAEHLPRNAGDPKFIEKFNRIVSSEVDKIDTIVKQLLEFSKPTAPRLQQLCIQNMLNDVLDLLNGEFIRYKIKLEKKFPNTKIYLDADDKQLKQAFLNIILNAIQAMPNGGTLTVDLSHHASKVTISILDTGCGISKENLAHIFDPFFTTKESGTGLGLAIVHGIIHEHGGKISANCNQPRGTTFNIELGSS